jgi:putative transposase
MSREPFYRTYRDDLLNSVLFEDLDQVMEISNGWMEGYDEQLPHDAQGGLPPVVYRERITRKASPSKVYS